MGPLRRFFSSFLSLVKEKRPPEAGQGGGIVKSVVCLSEKAMLHRYTEHSFGQDTQASQ